MDNKDMVGVASETKKSEEFSLDQLNMGEELTDEQLLQMAEGSCSWGANCRS